MIVYSTKIIQFVREVKAHIKTILSQEIRVKVSTNRFYDWYEMASYPITVVVYNTKSMLGYFDSNFFELGFHECLMYTSKEQLMNIIRHELGHYMTFINHGSSVPHHGSEFRAFCQQMGWGEEVYKATTCLDDGQNFHTFEESPIFRKIQKLMALATSSNENEAEQAMIKSQQLLLKHHVDAQYIPPQDDEEKMYLKRILKQKKENAKMRAIAKILETFFVSTVYTRAAGYIYLEILGNAVNVEIAEYVAGTLDHEFERLWSQTQRLRQNLKGMVAKNSFFLGIAKGYCNKIHALKKEYNSDTSHALMVIEKKLVDARELVYPRLSQTKSHAGYCHESATLGEQMGRQLTINPALNRSAKNSDALLTYSK